MRSESGALLSVKYVHGPAAKGSVALANIKRHIHDETMSDLSWPVEMLRLPRQCPASVTLTRSRELTTAGLRLVFMCVATA